MKVTGMITIDLDNLVTIVEIERDQPFGDTGELGDCVTVQWSDGSKLRLFEGDSAYLGNLHVHLIGEATPKGSNPS